MNQGNKAPERKSGISSILIFFIIGAFVLLLMRNTEGVERANVSFSHQIEHLVNLDLLQPKFSAKTAINENLVSFSGKFRDKKSEESKKRFRYLTLLEESNQFKEVKKESLKKIGKEQKQILANATYFYQLIGKKSLSSTQVIVPRYEEKGVLLSPIILDLRSINPFPVTLSSVDAYYQFLVKNSGGKEVSKLHRQLKILVSDFRSSKVGIGQRNIKNLLDSSSNLLLTDIDLSDCGKVIAQLKQAVSLLLQETNGVRFYGLRSVRNYLEDRELYINSSVALQDNQEKLIKAEEKVSNVIWFYDNREVSTKALANMDAEEYHRWYIGAKKNGKAFQKIQALPLNLPINQEI